MAMEVNGAAILEAIARNPDAFAFGPSQVNALAVATVLGRLRDKTVGLDQVRSIARVIGAHDFRLALDHLPPKDAAALSKRLDPKHPDLKAATESWHREQIWKLADAISEPTPTTAKTGRTARTSSARQDAAKTGEVMKSKALKPKAPVGPAGTRARGGSRTGGRS